MTRRYTNPRLPLPYLTKLGPSGCYRLHPPLPFSITISFKYMLAWLRNDDDDDDNE